MNIRRLLAVWSARLIKTACQLTGKQGVTLAGKIALSIYPPILKELAGEVKKEIFVVCGTNGKTTTNNLLASVLEEDGYKVVCNRTGSNMLNGVASAFVLSAGLSGHLKADYACIEIDEASTVRVFPHFCPDYMVLTNLFRDQLDRYGEIDITMDLLSRAMKMAPDMKVLVNGDDSLSTYLALENENPHFTFGIGQQVFRKEDTREIREGRFCKRCGEKMEYNFYHYSQLGDYYCPRCGFKRTLTGPMYPLPRALPLMWEISISKPITGDFIMFTISWLFMEPQPWQGFPWKISIKSLEIIPLSSAGTSCFRSPIPKLC